jgi:hypothetical protein
LRMQGEYAAARAAYQAGQEPSATHRAAWPIKTQRQPVQESVGSRPRRRQRIAETASPFARRCAQPAARSCSE